MKLKNLLVLEWIVERYGRFIVYTMKILSDFFKEKIKESYKYKEFWDKEILFKEIKLFNNCLLTFNLDSFTLHYNYL